MRRAPYVVFGPQEWYISLKGVITYKSETPPGYAVKVVGLANTLRINKGEPFDLEDVDGEYFTMYFCTPDDLRGFIESLQKGLEQWEQAGERKSADVCSEGAQGSGEGGRV